MHIPSRDHPRGEQFLVGVGRSAHADNSIVLLALHDVKRPTRSVRDGKPQTCLPSRFVRGLCGHRLHNCAANANDVRDTRQKCRHSYCGKRTPCSSLRNGTKPPVICYPQGRTPNNRGLDTARTQATEVPELVAYLRERRRRGRGKVASLVITDAVS